jgi:glutamate racemase
MAEPGSWLLLAACGIFTSRRSAVRAEVLACNTAVTVFTV